MSQDLSPGSSAKGALRQGPVTPGEEIATGLLGMLLAMVMFIMYQGTMGCTPNVRVPMVFIVFSRDSSG